MSSSANIILPPIDLPMIKPDWLTLIKLGRILANLLANTSKIVLRTIVQHTMGIYSPTFLAFFFLGMTHEMVKLNCLSKLLELKNS